QTDVTSLQNTTNTQTQEIATLNATVIKNITSRDATVFINRSANDVDLSVKSIDPLTIGNIISRDSGNTIRPGVDHLLYSAGGGSSFDPSVLAGIGLGYTNPTLNVKLGKSLETYQDQQGAIDLKLSKSPNNAASVLADGLFVPSGGGTAAGVSSLDGLQGGVTMSSGGVVEKIVNTNNKDIQFGVKDAVSQSKTLYYSQNGDDALSATVYKPIRTLNKAIELVKGISDDVTKIVCLDEQGSFSYTGYPGLNLGSATRETFNSADTTITYEFNAAFWTAVNSNGRTPTGAVNVFSLLGATTLIFAIGANPNQSVPSTNSFSFVLRCQVLQYSPAQTDYMVAIRALPELTGLYANMRNLYIKIETNEIVEEWTGTRAAPLPFINVNCQGFKTDANNQLDLTIEVTNNTIVDYTTGNIQRVPFVSITNYNPTDHAYLNIRVIGRTFGQGSKIWDITVIDPKITSYSVSTNEFLTNSQIVLPTNAVAIQQPPKPLTGATRYNVSAGLDKPVLEVFTSGQWRPVTSGSGGGSGNDDVIETIYYSSTGSNTNDGRTPEKAVADINIATNKAMSLRSDSAHDSLNPIYITSVGQEKNRQISGNISLVDGQVSYNLKYLNSDGIVFTQTITNPITKRNTTSITFNQIHNNSRILVNIDTTTGSQLDEFNLYITADKLEIDGTNVNPLVTVAKSSGTQGTTSIMKRLNIYFDICNVEELAPTDVTPAALVSCISTGLSNLTVFVSYKNDSQDISGATATSITRIVPFIITGTPDAQNPVLLSTYIQIKENASRLYDFSVTNGYSEYIIQLPNKLLTSSIQPAQLVVPAGVSNVPSTLSLNQDTLQYTNSFSVPVPVATQDYVQTTVTQSLANMNAKEQQQCATFPFYIKIDPVSASIYTPNIRFSPAGQDYPELSSIDVSSSFIIQEEFFNFRLVDLTQAGGTILPKQLQLDQWTGTGTQSKAFYGIGRIKFIDSTITVTDDTSSTDDILYNVAFTSTLSLDELNKNILPGIWVEFTNPADNKYVVAVIASKVVAGSGSNNYVVKTNIAFTNSKRQAELYTITDLSNKALSIYLCPFPGGVFAQDMKRFRNTITDNALCHVNQNYYIIGAHSVDVLEEALIILPYSPSYSALADSKTNPTWDRDIGKYQFSIGNSVPKILVEKLKTVWGEQSIKMGYINMIIPGLARDSTPGSRTLLGMIIQDTGSSYESTYLFSDQPTNPLYYNMPSTFNDLTNLSVVSNKIGCGLQLSSFIDGNAATVRISLNKDLDVRQTINDQDISGGIPSSFRSTTSSQAVITRASVLDESVLKNIAVYSKTTSKYRPFSNILTTSKAAVGLFVYIAGFSMPNSLNVFNHKLFIMNEPEQPVPQPSDDDVFIIGNYTQAEAIGNKGYYIRSDQTPVGHLVNT
ncbi:MAG: hypothetical protein ACRCX2_07935, partial [Paraclostridium sp.]